MPLESEPEAPSPVFTNLMEMLRENNQQNIKRESRFGTVEIQLWFQTGGDIDHIKVVVVQSSKPDETRTIFNVFQDGRVKTEVLEGASGSPQKVEPAFTLEELLAELK